MVSDIHDEQETALYLPRGPAIRAQPEQQTTEIHVFALACIHIHCIVCV